MRIILPHGESDPQKRYSMPDPDALLEAYTAVYHARFYGGRPATPDEIARVLTLASGYLDLTTYALGQECCVRKLRDIWRARRAKARPMSDEPNCGRWLESDRDDEPSDEAYAYANPYDRAVDVRAHEGWIHGYSNGRASRTPEVEALRASTQRELEEARARLESIDKQWANIHEHDEHKIELLETGLREARARIAETTSRLFAVGDSMTEFAYQELASALDASVRVMDTASELAAARARIAALEAGQDYCWHCRDGLMPAAKHCERCPAPGDCDDEDCQEDGCVEAKVPREAGPTITIDTSCLSTKGPVVYVAQEGPWVDTEQLHIDTERWDRDAETVRAALLAEPEAPREDECSGCGAGNCSALWPSQRKCCPDCSHKAPREAGR